MKNLQNIDKDKYLKNLEKRREKFKIDYEFQEVGLKLNNWFNINCFWVLYRSEAELEKVKYGLKICEEKGIKNIGYLLRILKNES